MLQTKKLDVLKHFFSFFISFPAYLAFYSSIIVIQGCNAASRNANFIWSFDIVNCFVGAPLLAGLFIDTVGVINTLPICDILLISGQLIIYYSIIQMNEILTTIGLFFTYYAYGLKETSRIVYTANSFIQKNNNKYNLKPFVFQSVLMLIARYLILLVSSLVEPLNNCGNLPQVTSLVCLGFSIFGLIVSFVLGKLNQIETKDQHENSSAEHSLLENRREPHGNVFVDFNNRIDQEEDNNPTFISVLLKIIRDTDLQYAKYWLLGSSCIVTIATLGLWHTVYPNVPALGYSLQILFTLVLLYCTSEKRMRFLTIVASFLLIAYQLYMLFDPVFVEWTLILALPVGALLTDLYTPVLLNYDLKYFGTFIGVKKWLENLLLLWASVFHSFGAGKYYKFGLIIFGFIMIIVFNEIYLKRKNRDVEEDERPVRRKGNMIDI